MIDRPITVLLLEDNPGDASIVLSMLRTIGEDFSVTHMTTLWEGLERLQKGGYDIVLLDLGLPDSAGLETLARARAQDPNVPIIVITGLTERDAAVAALDQGAQDFIAKERMDVHLLTRAILRCVGRNSESQEG